MVTAGGLVFQAGSIDRAIRAYAVGNGRELWRAQLPSGARATPMTYVARDGRQYVVISAGGNEEFGKGDYVVAYRAPGTLSPAAHITGAYLNRLPDAA